MIGLILIACGVIGLWGTLFKTPVNIGYIGLIIQMLFIALFVFYIMFGMGAITIKGA